MATETPPPALPKALPGTEEFTEVQQSADFAALRRAHRSFAFPLTIAFIAWYLLYVLLSGYAGGFMGTKVVGNLNVALVLGLAQFLTTFLIAWWYARHAAAELDPKAGAIKSRMESAESRTEDAV
ncbi:MULTISPECIES: DUF485 domain-containing protein [unclassified Streptomyces]|uniref:DUF485 domain-containing protein n=1 Tax=unclassified Streptomyces TaxID=2593676 RepID=UPI0013199419|nr:MULTISPECIES: DUF485 domain-containing protein [unclassified Streptomyces]QHC28841.1 DUF485 domain-containing protein [Streptomyces sp. HF10]WKE72408.1 DUF485 domain-containing protein [Streptomyces sp. WP-1]